MAKTIGQTKNSIISTLLQYSFQTTKRKKLDSLNTFKNIASRNYTSRGLTDPEWAQKYLMVLTNDGRECSSINLIGEHNPRRFYLLPKIHKPCDKWLTAFMPPMHPILSDCGSKSNKIAEYTNFHLNPFSTKHRSYFKNTYDFEVKIKTLKIPPEAFLFSLDVESLHTNMETLLGFQAVRDCFNKNPNPSRPVEAILQLLELSLMCNDFEFAGEFYSQVKGT